MSRAVRIRLENLPTDDDFDAFCLDEYREIRSGFSSGASRARRINLLLERVEPAEVDTKLTAWLAVRSGSAAPHVPMKPSRVWLAWAVAAVLGLIALLVSVQALIVRPPPPPQIIVIPVERFNRQLSAYGLTRDSLDSPEQFAAKVQKAGPDKVRYEVSIDSDRETQELRRLVIALRIQNDQLVAVTQYLIEQVERWRTGSTPQLQLLSQLTQGIEGKIEHVALTDLSAPSRPDLARPEDQATLSPPDKATPRPRDLIRAPVEPFVSRWDVDSIPKASVLRKADGSVLCVTRCVVEHASGAGTLDVILRAPGFVDKQLTLDMNWRFKPIILQPQPGMHPPEQLSHDQISTLFRSANVLECQAQGASGTYMVKLTIDPSGTIKDAKAISGGEGKDCVVKAVKFPQFSGYPMSLTYPFIVP